MTLNIMTFILGSSEISLGQILIGLTQSSSIVPIRPTGKLYTAPMINDGRKVEENNFDSKSGPILDALVFEL